MQNFALEQREIMRLSDEIDEIKGRSWNRFRGDVIARKIIKFVNRHIPKEFKMVGPNVYIEGIPTEFDALVVKSTAIPLENTAAYKGSDVVVVLEIKKHGFYYKKTEGSYKISTYFEQFLKTNKPFLYITVKESEKFINMTRSALKDNAFFLGISGRKELILREWERFIKRITKLINFRIK